MQTAVDCNGSSSSGNNCATTTTTIVESINVKHDACTELLSHNATPCTATSTATRSTPAVMLTPAAMLEQTSVLRHRLQVGGAGEELRVGMGHIIGSSNGDSTTHKIVVPISPPLIDLAEYLGSNVECMSVTPSPSPQASPSKKAQQPKSVDSLPIVTLSAEPTASSSTSSSSSSSSNSSTSSVIASPANIDRKRCMLETKHTDQVSVDDALNSIGNKAHLSDKDERVERRVALTAKGLPLHNVYEEHLTFITPTSPLTPALSLASPSSPSSPSSSTSSSLSACTNSTNTPASADSISLDSTTNSSKSSLVTIKSPAFDPTVQLQQWEDMPKYLQFNPYVLKGYRPLTTFKGCLLSLFQWHNETINILTHAIPIFYILAIVPGLMPWEQEYRFLSFCHLAGSVAPWCGSFLYHLFMNIERGEHVYYTLLKLDMVGIWVSQSFGALPLVTATTFCLSPIWKWLIIISYCLLSLWGLYKALTASSPWQRRLCFALPFTMRSILTFFRTIGVWVGGSRLSLSHVYLQDGVSILGGVIGAMRIPEKWFPGLLDFYLNSHNIMHVLVVVAVYSMHKATVKDIEWMSATNCTLLTGTTNDIGETIDTTFTSNVEL